MAKAGSDYEIFVSSIQQAIINSEELGQQKNITVETNKIITDSFGIKREFDVYWEYELGGIVHKTVIECKDYSSSVSMEKIDALIGKVRDFPGLRPVFATKKGYQSGAIKKAKANNVELLIVREQNETDWISKDGTPLLKEVHITMNFFSGARISNVSPLIDGKWVKENTDLDISKPLRTQERNDKIIIDDVTKGRKYSVHELEQQLGRDYSESPGSHTIKEEFEEAYISYSDDLKLKIISLEIEFFISRPEAIPIHIDYSKELIGVVEYLHRDTKASVFSDKIIHE